jgi:hypothetical protein
MKLNHYLPVVLAALAIHSGSSALAGVFPQPNVLQHPLTISLTLESPGPFSEKATAKTLTQTGSIVSS